MGQILKSLCWLTCLIAAAGLSTYAQPTKNVLIISAEQDHVPAIALADRGVRDSFKDVRDFKVRFFRESLDASRIDGQKYEKEFAELLQHKYDGQKVDLILIYGRTALAFLAGRKSLFPDTPKVFAASDQQEVAGLELDAHTIGATGKIELGPTLELMLGQNPNARKIAVVFGNSPFDRSWKDRAKLELDAYSKRVEIEYPPATSMDVLRAHLAALPSDAAILFVTFSADGEGNSYTTPEALSLTAAAANNPIYTLSDASMGSGTVGGAMLSYQAIGFEVGELGKQILYGRAPAELQGRIVPPVPIFDWRQLQKWGIDENRLPYGSRVEYRVPPVWEQYRAYIAAAITVGIVQSLLIAWLLLVQSRRRKAEAERSEFQTLLAAEHGRLDEVVTNVPGIVWESRIVDETGRRRAQFVSGYVEEMLGFTVDECLADPDFIVSKILEEDREPYRLEVDAVFRDGKQRTVQFRCITKGGGWKWAESHVIAVRDGSGKTVGLRGVTMDITERKRVEDDLIANEKQLSEAQRLAQVGSWEWDSVTDSVTWSEEVYRIYGLDSSKPAVSFQEHRQLVVPESWERLQLEVANTLKTGDPYEIEIELVRVDGSHAWGSARGEIVPDSGSLKLRGTLQDITERKKAESAVRESEARFTHMADTAPTLIWVSDLDMLCTYFNKTLLDFTGLSMEEMLGDRWLEIVHEDDRQGCIDAYTKGYESHEPFILEYRLRRADGEYRWLYDTGAPRFASNGEFLGYIGSAVDITDRKAADDAIRESEARFRTIADSSPVLIWMSDVSPLITFVNRYCTNFTGMRQEQLTGTAWLDAIHPDDRQRCIDIYTSAYERREPFVYEFRIRRADGVYQWFYSTSAPRLSVNGEFLGYIGTCVDIDDRKKAEDSLQLALTEINQLKNALHEENIYLKEEIKLIHNFDEIIGESEALKYVLFKIEQVAPTNATVMISGETGTGKELVARAVHSASLRKNKPLVKVNCAALAANFIESELFGHEKGSFTGASAKRIGRFELAQGGTIFLDEIGELPMDLQVKLLRILQEGEFERLGSSKTIKIDVRVIAATNRDLRAEVQKGNFREDLLFRLNVFPITVPPLRERADDIPLLVNYFAGRFSKQLGKSITSVSPTALRALTSHTWPGNVRELANVIERSVIGTKGDILKTIEAFEKAAVSNGHAAPTDTLESMERKYIAQILGSTGWRIEGESGAARILGLNPSTLRTRMSKLCISRKPDQTNGS